MTINLLLTVINTISTFFVFEWLRRAKFKLQLFLKTLFVAISFCALPFAVIANGKMLDESILPKLGLMRCIRLPYHHSSFFFGIGMICANWVFVYTLIDGAAVVPNLLRPNTTKKDG